MIRFQKILCPIDFSSHANVALEHAEEIAKRFGAELLVAHVVEPVLYPVAYGLPPVAPVNYEESARENAGKALAPLVEAINRRGGKARALVSTGLASVRICEMVTEEGADLVVLSTHGYTGLKHVLLGSTAERVVRSCPCPVLTVKASDKS
jgi:nucleotide-binding universal stress UspA family protein